MPQQLLTVPQVAKILQVHEHTVWDWIYLRKIPSIKLNGIRRIPKDQFNEWLEDNTHGLSRKEIKQ